MKRTLIALMAIIIAIGVKAQNISGQIIDASTGDSIPYASAIYKGHHVMVASDGGGRFSIARHNGWTLTFSAVGYKPEKVTIKANTVGNLVIKLTPAEAHALEGVTVKAKRKKYSRKNNPAVELMKRVVEGTTR